MLHPNQDPLLLTVRFSQRKPPNVRPSAQAVRAGAETRRGGDGRAREAGGSRARRRV